MEKTMTLNLRVNPTVKQQAEPQLRLYAGGRREVSAHQHRGQLYLRDPRRGSRHPAGCGGRYRRHEHPA